MESMPVERTLINMEDTLYMCRDNQGACNKYNAKSLEWEGCNKIRDNKPVLS